MNQSLFQRFLGLALALVLLAGALPVTALAAETENASFTLTELKSTHVTLDETVFQYTGQEIRPNVTVRVQDRLLTLDQDYRLEYADNVEVGTAKVIVTGIGTASAEYGYSGTVEVPFYINAKAPETPEEPEFTLIPLKGTDVTIDGTSFPYTGEPIEPAVTVTVEGQVLTAGRDYAVEYANNLVPGTGTVIVRGIATASETLGYTGEVRIDFTIEQIPEETPSETTPEETPGETTPEETPGETTPEETPGETTPEETPGETTPEETPGETTPEETPGETTPEETTPEETTPEEDPKPSYKITKGSGSKWFWESTKNLRFTADGKFADFVGVAIDGRKLDASYYTVAEGSTVVTLKNSFLKKLNLGGHTITIRFQDGEATGTFTVAAGLDTTNPQTSDNFPLGVLTTVLFLSLAGLVGAAFLVQKKRSR